MTQEKCRHLVIERYPPSSADYQCQQCLAPIKVRAVDELAAPREVGEALKTAQQALLEVRHAQSVGCEWYTKGHSGLYQQVEMWSRRGLEAIKKAEFFIEPNVTP